MNVKEVQTVINRYINALCIPYYYSEHWSETFCMSEYQEYCKKFLSNLKDKIDFNTLTVEECNLLGFGRYSETSNLRLIPLYLYDVIPDGQELYCINGKKYIKGKDHIDKDIRGGYLAYGIIPVEYKDN